MAVRLRLKRMGRRHRPFFRICAMDARCARDGKVIEELGYYDPMIGDVDARTVLKRERVDYWLGVGAQPTPKVKVLIKKYGTDGTHLSQQETALERVRSFKPTAPPPTPLPPPPAPAAETPEAETPQDETAAEGSDESSESAAASEAPAEATTEPQE